MKKILAALLAALMIISLLPVSVFAESTTLNYTFADYAAGTQYAKNEEHVLDDKVTVVTTECHFTTQLRIYSSSTHDGYVIIKANNISKLGVNAGENKDTLLIQGSNDEGANWEDIGRIDVTSTSYKNYELSFADKYNWLKIDVDGTNQVRLKAMSLTLEAATDTDNGCKHTNVKNIDAVDATCTENGKTAGKTCSDCGFVLENQETIPAKGHSIVNGACSVCGYTAVFYTLVTDVADLYNGAKIAIVAADANFAMSTVQNNNNRGLVAVSKVSNQVEMNDNIQVITLEKGDVENTFAFNVGDGYLYAASSSSNYLRTQSTKDSNGSWLITIADGVASVVAQGSNTNKVLRYNSTSSLFACYASDKAANQKDIAIYMLVSNEAPCDHAWDEGEVTTEPDCETEGVKTYTCGNCGETKTEAIAATGHTPVTDAAEAPGCETTGLTEGSHCEICGVVLVKQEEVPATDHAWGEGEVTTKPDCENEGVKTYTCGNCGDTKTEAIEATGHDFGEEVYNEETKKFEKVCGVCKEIESREPTGITITEQPEGTTAIVGTTKTFAVAATGEGQLTYLWKYHREGMEENQWYYWSEPSTTKTSINVKATAQRQGYQFKCIITDAYGNTVETEPVTLTVNTDDAIVISTQPAAQDTTAGETVVFSVTATGADLTYLWQYRREADGAWYYWSNPSKDATSIQVGATVARNGYEFRCVITDANGVKKITEEVTLTVNAKELTTTVTANGAAFGETFSMDVVVSVAGEYTYLWKYQRPSMAEDTWYYWAQPKAESGMTGKATESRIGYRFKCVIYDAYGNETVTGIYELKADGSLELVP